MNNIPSDERRKDFRADVPVCLSIDVPVALSHKALKPSEGQAVPWTWDELAVTPDLLKTMVDEKDLIIRDPLLLQVLTRIDWLLTSIIKTLSKDKNLTHAIPEFITVNLSSSGIRFLSDQEYTVGGFLVLRLLLRPFIPIQAVGKVLRVCPARKIGEQQFETAVEFTEIAADDREAIIRHVLRAQASIQRHRNSQDSVLS